MFNRLNIALVFVCLACGHLTLLEDATGQDIQKSIRQKLNSAALTKVAGVSMAIDVDIPELDQGVGPEGEQLPDKKNCVWIRVPAGKTLVVRVAAKDEAHYENAVQVHDDSYIRQLECGNYHRDPQPARSSQRKTETPGT